MSPITMIPIGSVHSTRRVVSDDDWDREQVYIELDTAQLSADALQGLESFSHVEVLFYMHRVDAAKIETAARHPRNNRAWPKVGILAQRAKHRPNQLGSTVCRVVRVEQTRLLVDGLDAIDGSPVLDIKPWLRQLGPRGEVQQPPWVDELMRGYWNQNGA